MGRIPDDVIDQVLAAYDIVEVVGRYLPLKSAGRAFKALCPFHEEKTPSFTVNPDRQTFKCFGCGKGGNVFRFLMEHEGLTFPEAVRSLARDRGIVVPESHGASREEQSRVEVARGALKAAHAFFVRCLQSDEGSEARAYLTKRGYDEEAVRRFELGYAPPAWDRLVQTASRRGVGGDVLEDAGLALPRREGGHYDRFRHRVVFPIADLQGRVITFGARALSDEDQPKYLNGPETSVFKKASVLYGLDRARDGIRKHGEALLMEGYTDVLTCHLHGIDRAVAGMGTAFTPQQARLVKRFAQRVVLVYDGDEAGLMAAERTLDILVPEGLEVAVVLLPEGRDVDEILLEEGAESFETRIASALDLLDFKLQALARQHDPESPRGLAEFAESLMSTFLRVPSPVERQDLIREAAQRLRRTGDMDLEKALRTVAGRIQGTEGERARQRSRRAETAEQGPTLSRAQKVAERTRRETEEFLLAGYLLFPDLGDAISRAVGPEDFTSPVARRIYNAALSMREAGGTSDLRALVARMAEDSEAQDVLAGLSEDPTLEESVPSHIAFLERDRRNRRRAREIRRQLGGADPGPDDSPLDSPDETVVGERPDGAAPREHVG